MKRVGKEIFARVCSSQHKIPLQRVERESQTKIVTFSCENLATWSVSILDAPMLRSSEPVRSTHPDVHDDLGALGHFERVVDEGRVLLIRAAEQRGRRRLGVVVAVRLAPRQQPPLVPLLDLLAEVCTSRESRKKKKKIPARLS